MCKVQIDEDGFFTGSYVQIGNIAGGVEVDELPPSENPLCYKLVENEVLKSYEVPVLKYVTEKESKTDFDVSYCLTSTDDEGNTVKTYITEDEYNALSEVERENVEIISIPQFIMVEISKEEYDFLDDVERDKVIVSYKYDDDGNIIYETAEKTETIKVWEFSQEKYDEIENQKDIAKKQEEENNAYLESISNKVLKEENEKLTEQVEMLTSCILEMSEMLYA